MFDVGFSELVLIFVIALIVLGPERLPKVARTAGRWVGQARRMAQTMQRELERELDLNEIGNESADKSNVTPHPKYGQMPERARTSTAASQAPATTESASDAEPAISAVTATPIDDDYGDSFDDHEPLEDDDPLIIEEALARNAAAENAEAGASPPGDAPVAAAPSDRRRG